MHEDRLGCPDVGSGMEQATMRATDVRNVERWVAGDNARCPICREAVREGDDCSEQHYDECGSPETLAEAKAAIEARSGVRYR